MRDLWTDKRTPPDVRRAANKVLQRWMETRGETLEPVAVSGFGTVFESDRTIVVGRANDARKAGESGTLFWNSITRRHFDRLNERASAAGKRVVFLFIAYRPPRIYWFELPGDKVPLSSLPGRRDGGANLTIQQTRAGPVLKTNAGPLDLTPYQFVMEGEEPRRTAPPDLLARITIEPGKRSGKPCIRGLRITVDDILEYLAAGMSEREILADLPDLELEDIRATLAFAARRERMLRSA
jgi:uncharacterized protein (DUF433 family)